MAAPASPSLSASQLAVQPRAATRPPITTRPRTRSSARSSLARTGAGATSTRSRSSSRAFAARRASRPHRSSPEPEGSHMATVTHAAHRPALDEQRRREVARDLQMTLVELIDLSLIGKQLHWNIVGRPFKPLHEHLDEVVDTWRELSDTVAERAVVLGVAPDGRPGTIASGSGIDPIVAGALDTDTALRELVTRLADVSER